MARNVYSAQFIVYTASTPNPGFEVPAGFTAVVRYATVAQDIGAYDWILQFANSEEAPYCVFHLETGVGALQSASWEGRVVVPAGGLIVQTLTAYGDTPYGYVGGYLLRDP